MGKPLNFVNNMYKNKLYDDLFASLAYLFFTSSTNKGVNHSDGLYKATDTRNHRDLFYKKDLKRPMPASNKEEQYVSGMMNNIASEA